MSNLRFKSSKVCRIALLGCGTVGSRVAQLLLEERERIAHDTGLDLELTKILVRDVTRSRDISSGYFTDCFDKIQESRPDCVIELLGGDDPAFSYISRLLKTGINVVTANKTVIAIRGRDLREIATQNSIGLAYEASVCSAIPLLASIKQLAGDRINSIQGIVNGSTNYILSRMSDNGLSQNEALKEAREKGLVEPNPAADVSGRDSAEKLCILANEIGVRGHCIDVTHIDTEGIEQISQDDVLAARRLGFAVKLVAECLRNDDGSVSLRVGPTLVRKDHQLASVNLQSNGIIINTTLGGELFLQGAGAGSEPTASAILGDVVRLLKDSTDQTSDQTSNHVEDAPWREEQHVVVSTVKSSNFVRITTTDSSLSPGKVFAAFRNANIHIKHIDALPSRITLLTSETTLGDVNEVIAKLKSQGSVETIVVPELFRPSSNKDNTSHLTEVVTRQLNERRTA